MSNWEPQPEYFGLNKKTADLIESLESRSEKTYDRIQGVMILIVILICCFFVSNDMRVEVSDNKIVNILTGITVWASVGFSAFLPTIIIHSWWKKREDKKFEDKMDDYKKYRKALRGYFSSDQYAEDQWQEMEDYYLKREHYENLAS